MIQYLLDTHVVSELSKPQPNSALTVAFGTRRDAIAISSVTLHELRFGIEPMQKGAKRDFLEQFFRDTIMLLPVLAYDDRAALWHAAERARLVAKNRTPAFADGQIIAVAAVNDLTLVTANTSVFAQFAGVKLENWFKRK
jgi:tRNA(fMet)-specific endonuclease VapC